MIIAESNRYYRIQLIFKRLRHGMILFSIRNLLSRTGIDIEAYYWVKEGSKAILPPLIKGNLSDYEVKNLSYEETRSALKISSGMQHHLENLKTKFENGQSCIALTHDDKVVAYMFIETKDFILRHKLFKLKENEAYLLNMYTFETFRGQNYAPYLRYKSYQLLKKQGIEHIYSISAYFNKSSIKFKRKLNAINLKLYLSIELFNIFSKTFLLKTFKDQLKETYFSEEQ